MSAPIKIAIIGGGASGTISAIQLLSRLEVKAKIFLIEKNKEALFRGAAYANQLAYEPLNVQAGRMSIYNHLPDDFYDWVKAKKESSTGVAVSKDTFVSRRWFGDYLTENFVKAKKHSKTTEAEIIHAACEDLAYDASSNQYTLSFKDREHLSADCLVFACGNEPPSDIFSRAETEAMGDNYISNPWGTNPFEELKETDDVLIIGTGLTMIDHAVSLQKQNHKGKIYCISRNGYLPLPHTDIQHFAFDITKEPTELKEALDVLNQNITTAKAQNITWQNVMDAMRPHTSRIWKQMSLKSKKLFLEKLRKYWEIHRHRMPLPSAIAIEQMQSTGQLKIVAGYYQSLQLNNEGIIFNYVSKGVKQKCSLTVNRIINCTGPSSDYYKTGSVLFKNLLDKGWMKQDSLKLGIETGSNGEIIKNNGTVLQNTFAIGPLRKAAEWETIAVREIRTQAEGVAILLSSYLNRPAE